MRLGPRRQIVRSLVRLSKMEGVHLVRRSGDFYVYPTAYTALHPPEESTYIPDLRGKRKGEVFSFFPWNEPHFILEDLSTKSEGTCPSYYKDRLLSAGLIEDLGQSEGSKIFKITAAGEKVREKLESGKRVGFTREEVDLELLEGDWRVRKGLGD